MAQSLCLIVALSLLLNIIPPAVPIVATGCNPGLVLSKTVDIAITNIFESGRNGLKIAGDSWYVDCLMTAEAHNTNCASCSVTKVKFSCPGYGLTVFVSFSIPVWSATVNISDAWDSVICNITPILPPTTTTTTTAPTAAPTTPLPERLKAFLVGSGNLSIGSVDASACSTHLSYIRAAAPYYRCEVANGEMQLIILTDSYPGCYKGFTACSLSCIKGLDWLSCPVCICQSDTARMNLFLEYTSGIKAPGAVPFTTLQPPTLTLTRQDVEVDGVQAAVYRLIAKVPYKSPIPGQYSMIEHSGTIQPALFTNGYFFLSDSSFASLEMSTIVVTALPSPAGLLNYLELGTTVPTCGYSRCEWVTSPHFTNQTQLLPMLNQINFFASTMVPSGQLALLCTTSSGTTVLTQVPDQNCTYPRQICIYETPDDCSKTHAIPHEDSFSGRHSMAGAIFNRASGQKVILDPELMGLWVEHAQIITIQESQIVFWVEKPPTVDPLNDLVLECSRLRFLASSCRGKLHNIIITAQEQIKSLRSMPGANANPMSMGGSRKRRNWFTNVFNTVSCFFSSGSFNCDAASTKAAISDLQDSVQAVIKAGVISSQRITLLESASEKLSNDIVLNSERIHQLAEQQADSFKLLAHEEEVLQAEIDSIVSGFKNFSAYTQESFLFRDIILEAFRFMNVFSSDLITFLAHMHSAMEDRPGRSSATLSSIGFDSSGRSCFIANSQYLVQRTSAGVAAKIMHKLICSIKDEVEIGFRLTVLPTAVKCKMTWIPKPEDMSKMLLISNITSLSNCIHGYSDCYKFRGRYIEETSLRTCKEVGNSHYCLTAIPVTDQVNMSAEFFPTNTLTTRARLTPSTYHGPATTELTPGLFWISEPFTIDSNVSYSDVVAVETVDVADLGSAGTSFRLQVNNYTTVVNSPGSTDMPAGVLLHSSCHFHTQITGACSKETTTIIPSDCSTVTLFAAAASVQFHTGHLDILPLSPAIDFSVLSRINTTALNQESAQLDAMVASDEMNVEAILNETREVNDLLRRSSNLSSQQLDQLRQAQTSLDKSRADLARVSDSDISTVAIVFIVLFVIYGFCLAGLGFVVLQQKKQISSLEAMLVVSKAGLATSILLSTPSPSTCEACAEWFHLLALAVASVMLLWKIISSVCLAKHIRMRRIATRVAPAVLPLATASEILIRLSSDDCWLTQSQASTWTAVTLSITFIIHVCEFIASRVGVGAQCNIDFFISPSHPEHEAKAYMVITYMSAVIFLGLVTYTVWYSVVRVPKDWTTSLMDQFSIMFSTKYPVGVMCMHPMDPSLFHIKYAGKVHSLHDPILWDSTKRIFHSSHGTKLVAASTQLFDPQTIKMVFIYDKATGCYHVMDTAPPTHEYMDIPPQTLRLARKAKVLRNVEAHMMSLASATSPPTEPTAPTELDDFKPVPSPRSAMGTITLDGYTRSKFIRPNGSLSPNVSYSDAKALYEALRRGGAIPPSLQFGAFWLWFPAGEQKLRTLIDRVTFSSEESYT